MESLSTLWSHFGVTLGILGLLWRHFGLFSKNIDFQIEFNDFMQFWSQLRAIVRALGGHFGVTWGI